MANWGDLSAVAYDDPVPSRVNPGRSNDYPMAVKFRNRSRGEMKYSLGENPLNRSALQVIDLMI